MIARECTRCAQYRSLASARATLLEEKLSTQHQALRHHPVQSRAAARTSRLLQDEEGELRVSPTGRRDEPEP